jgi:hypothetical protein
MAGAIRYLFEPEVHKPYGAASEVKLQKINSGLRAGILLSDPRGGSLLSDLFVGKVLGA